MSASSKAMVYEPSFTRQGDNLLYDARLLHRDLEIETKFTTWIQRRIQEYGFEKEVDFFPKMGESIGGRKSKEYFLTLDMCKEIGMVERTEIGRIIRKKFIEAEKELHAKRLYGQKLNLTELKRKVETRRVNGYTLYPYRQVQELLGFSTKTGVSNVRRGYAGLLLMMDNRAWVAEQYVQVMVARATARAKTLEAKATQPVLPMNFGMQELPFTHPQNHA